MYLVKRQLQEGKRVDEKCQKEAEMSRSFLVIGLVVDVIAHLADLSLLSQLKSSFLNSESWFEEVVITGNIWESWK